MGEETYKVRAEYAQSLWNKAANLPVPGVEWIQAYATDVPMMLRRIRELEKENEELEREIGTAIEYRRADEW